MADNEVKCTVVHCISKRNGLGLGPTRYKTYTYRSSELETWKKLVEEEIGWGNVWFIFDGHCAEITW